MTNTACLPSVSATYIPSLDGWRAIAILMVFASHAGLGQIVPGGLGVTIFFFLSGYLITTLMIQEQQRNGKIALQHFFLRRVFRLMPPLLITLVFAYGLTYAGVTKGHVSWAGFSAQLLYFANYYYLYFDYERSVPAGTAIFWSLAVEEHFYAVFPFAFYAFYSCRGRFNLVNVLVAICVVTLLWRFALIVAFDSSANRTYYATDTRIDSIVFGCLLALIKNPVGVSLNVKIIENKEWLMIFISISALLLSLIVRDSVFRETLRYSIQGAALAPLFYFSICRHQCGMFAMLNISIIKKIGQYSYSIYLIHYIVLMNVSDLNLPVSVALFLSILVILLFSILIDNMVDRPFARLRRRFR